MAKRDETLSKLGRAPARLTKDPSPAPEPSGDRGAARRWLRGALLDNLALKFLSMVLAITVFLLVNTDRQREVTERIGVTRAMPSEDKVLVAGRIDEVHVTLKGSQRRLRNIKLDPINLDLRDAPSGDIPITFDMIRVPPGVEVVNVSPASIHVEWDTRVEREFDIAPSVTGEPQHGYLISEIKAVPAKIMVRGAKRTLAALQSVRTKPVSVEGRAESFTADTEVVAPEGSELVGPTKVIARISIDEELVTRKLPGISVALRGEGVDPAKWQITPATVDVTLTGALLAVEKAKTTLTPVVKLPPGAAGPREIDVSVEGLPPGIGVKLSPERVRVLPSR